MKGKILPRIPRFDFRPPNKTEVKSEKVAAEATSKILAIIPTKMEASQ